MYSGNQHGNEAKVFQEAWKYPEDASIQNQSDVFDPKLNLWSLKTVFRMMVF